MRRMIHLYGTSMRQRNMKIGEYMAQGVSRATAYRRLGGIGHCKSCSCFKGYRETNKVEEPVKTIEDFKRSNRFELCSKHGSMKVTCGC